MEFLFAYFAGLLTLINPCVLPVLPIVLGSAAQSNRHGPLALAAGMGVTFVAFGLFVNTVGRSIGLTDTLLSQIGALMMVGFGLILMTPPLAHRFEVVMAGIAGRADARFDGIDRSGLSGQFLGGALLGLVWSPCVGPTLGGAISLAAQGESLLRAGAIMTAFALGIGTIIVALGYGTRELILKRQAGLRRLASRGRAIMGAMFALVGLAIYFELTRVAEFWLLDHLPFWLQDLSIKF